MVIKMEIINYLLGAVSSAVAALIVTLLRRSKRRSRKTEDYTDFLHY